MRRNSIRAGLSALTCGRASRRASSSGTSPSNMRPMRASTVTTWPAASTPVTPGMFMSVGTPNSRHMDAMCPVRLPVWAIMAEARRMTDMALGEE